MSTHSGSTLTTDLPPTLRIAEGNPHSGSTLTTALPPLQAVLHKIYQVSILELKSDSKSGKKHGSFGG